MKVDKELTQKRKMLVAKLVRKARRVEDITQKELSEGLGHTQPNFMQRIEAGNRHLDVYELWEICQFMKISFSELCQEIDKRLKKDSNE